MSEEASRSGLIQAKHRVDGAVPTRSRMMSNMLRIVRVPHFWTLITDYVFQHYGNTLPVTLSFKNAWTMGQFPVFSRRIIGLNY